MIARVVKRAGEFPGDVEARAIARFKGGAVFHHQDALGGREGQRGKLEVVHAHIFHIERGVEVAVAPGKFDPRIVWRESGDEEVRGHHDGRARRAEAVRREHEREVGAARALVDLQRGVMEQAIVQIQGGQRRAAAENRSAVPVEGHIIGRVRRVEGEVEREGVRDRGCVGELRERGARAACAEGRSRQQQHREARRPAAVRGILHVQIVDVVGRTLAAGARAERGASLVRGDAGDGHVLEERLGCAGCAIDVGRHAHGHEGRAAGEADDDLGAMKFPVGEIKRGRGGRADEGVVPVERQVVVVNLGVVVIVDAETQGVGQVRLLGDARSRATGAEGARVNKGEAHAVRLIGLARRRDAEIEGGGDGVPRPGAGAIKSDGSGQRAQVRHDPQKPTRRSGVGRQHGRRSAEHVVRGNSVEVLDGRRAVAHGLADGGGAEIKVRRDARIAARRSLAEGNAVAHRVRRAAPEEA